MTNISAKRGSWIRFVAVLSAAAVGNDVAAQGYWSLLGATEAKVVTVTDMTEPGRKLRRPTPDALVYYEALVLGYSDFGRSVAGHHPPAKKDMLKLILKLLGDQGYVPAKPGHAPEMLLTFAWGTINDKPGMALPFMGGEKLDLMWEVDGQNPSLRYLTRFNRSPAAELVAESTLSTSSPSQLYMISIQAFDEAEAINGRTKLLWHTKVSCPSAGLAMAATLKHMAREAAPFFGTETAKPMLTSKRLDRAQVDLGELKVLETIDPEKLPITEY